MFSSVDSHSPRPFIGCLRPSRRGGGTAVWAACAAVLALGAASCRPPASANEAQNLVLIVIDTLRQDRLGAYGYPRPVSPVLDALARSGAVADGLSPTSWTRPAMATLFTGLHPLRHQVAASTDRIPGELPTLPQILRERGFDTLGVSTNGHVSSAWGFDRGFREFLPTWKLGYGLFATSADVNELLLPRLESLRPPYFLFVHYLDPHQPYDPPAAFDGTPLSEDLAKLAPLREGETYPTLGAVAPELLRAASDLYDGEIRANDRAVGELLERLRELGLNRNTLVVVTSDHGEEFFEHGRSGHGKQLFAESTAVPLLFQGEGVVCPGARLGRMGLEDVAPTVLSLLGVDSGRAAPRGLDGIDQSAALRCGGVVEERPRLLYLEGDPDAGLAVVEGDWKLLLGLEPYRKAAFDLARDPGETRDRLGEPEGAVAVPRLAQTLAELYNGDLRAAYPRDTTTADQELTEQLAALGYGGVRNPVAARRTFPRRLRPADETPGGLRGWEDVDGFASCADLRDDPSRQLLAGWWRPTADERGRWTAAAGTFALRAPAEASPRLAMRGHSYRPDPVRLEVEPVSGGARWSGEIAPGAFELELAVPDLAPGEVALFRFVAAPAYVPAEHGLDDARSLGVFVESLCLRAGT